MADKVAQVQQTMDAAMASAQDRPLSREALIEYGVARLRALRPQLSYEEAHKIASSKLEEKLKARPDLEPLIRDAGLESVTKVDPVKKAASDEAFAVSVGPIGARRRPLKEGETAESVAPMVEMARGQWSALKHAQAAGQAGARGIEAGAKGALKAAGVAAKHLPETTALYLGMIGSGLGIISEDTAKQMVENAKAGRYFEFGG